VTANRPLRIGYGRIFHEANAYAPAPTELDAFTRFHLLEEAELERAAGLFGSELKGFLPAAELTGFRAAAARDRNVTPVPLVSAMTVPSGPLTEACFSALLERLRATISAALATGLDGVYLALHGSMQVAGAAGRPPGTAVGGQETASTVSAASVQPEARILAEVRALIGDRPLAVSYDLHANLTAPLVDPATILVSYLRNPHWDLAPTGYRAATRLFAAARGMTKPTSTFRKLPMVLGGGTTLDLVAPMRGIYKEMRRWERSGAVLTASAFLVHPYTTAAPLGWAAHVTTDGDPAAADRYADALADRLWEARKVPLPPRLTIAEALEKTAESRRSGRGRFGPVTLIDEADIVGAGAPGGNTQFVAEAVASKSPLRGYIPVHDPALVAELRHLAPGTVGDFVLRGSPGYEMPEVPLAGATVGPEITGPFGRIRRLEVPTGAGTLCLAVGENALLPVLPSFWTDLGLPLRGANGADYIVQKNFFHYRIFYATTSFEHFLVRSPVGGATNLDRVIAQAHPTPTWPAVDPGDWRPGDAFHRGVAARGR
jgi:microcystin degradation protein MlrC